MITEAMVRAAGKYSPERIPDSWFGTVPGAAELAPPVLDLRRFTPYICTLTDIQLTANALVAVVARYDGARVLENTAAMLSVQQGAWRLPAKEYLYYNLAGVTAAPVVPYSTHFSVWVKNPTVADKIFHGITLTTEERALAESLGIYNTVEKGLLPLSIGQQIGREYIVTGEETHSRIITLAVAGNIYTIENLYPNPDEFIVLTRIASTAGAPADDVRFTIDRDDNGPYADVRTPALSLILGGEVNCFIPAIKEIRLTSSSTLVPGAAVNFRFTFQRIKLTNILRCRFGLVTRDEIPGETWDKVRAGIL